MDVSIAVRRRGTHRGRGGARDMVEQEEGSGGSSQAQASPRSRSRDRNSRRSSAPSLGRSGFRRTLLNQAESRRKGRTSARTDEVKKSKSEDSLSRNSSLFRTVLVSCAPQPADQQPPHSHRPNTSNPLTSHPPKLPPPPHLVLAPPRHGRRQLEPRTHELPAGTRGRERSQRARHGRH